MGGTVKINHARHNEAQIGYAPSGSIVTSEPTIIFDGKTLHGDPDNIWSTDGTGTSTYTNPLTELSVAAGEYMARQTTRCMPYFAGYPMYAEFTFDGFGSEEGVTKRIGYYGTSTAAPYTANRDGFWLESDGDTFYIKAANNGTTTASVPLRNWHGYKILKDYDWDQFTVIMFDHLWLGGAALRMWVATWQHGWVLAHTVPYVGEYQGPITQCPQNFLRYDIHSTGGAGSMRAICCQYSVLGDVAATAYADMSVQTSGISCSSASVVYALQGIKKASAYRRIGVRFIGIASATGSANDTGQLMLLKNPTLSSALTYSDYGRVQQADATNQTISDLGEIIAHAPSARGSASILDSNYSAWATQSIDDTFDEFVVAFAPSTTNQSLRSTVSWKEFG